MRFIYLYLGRGEIINKGKESRFKLVNIKTKNQQNFLSGFLINPTHTPELLNLCFYSISYRLITEKVTRRTHKRSPIQCLDDLRRWELCTSRS